KELFNICIPTLTKEVVKKSQKISVTKNVQTFGEKVLAAIDAVGSSLFGSSVVAVTARA
ncbi:MAG: hypothetical protein UX21_C0050G0006, partial [Microgenomates group bacterium GW2011_GWC2_45_8]